MTTVTSTLQTLQNLTDVETVLLYCQITKFRSRPETEWIPYILEKENSKNIHLSSHMCTSSL